MLHCVNLEAPMSVKLSKVMCLSLMHMLCSLYQPTSTNSVTIDLSMQGQFIDIVSDMLVNCQMAEDLASKLGNQDRCYCGEENKKK